MRLIVAAAAFVAAVFISPPALACESPARVIEGLSTRFPDTSLRAHLTGRSAAAFVLRYNRVPPETAYRADEVLVFEDPNFPRFNLIELFLNGCLVGGGVLAAPFVDILLSVDGADI